MSSENVRDHPRASISARSRRLAQSTGRSMRWRRARRWSSKSPPCGSRSPPAKPSARPCAEASRAGARAWCRPRHACRHRASRPWPGRPRRPTAACRVGPRSHRRHGPTARRPPPPKDRLARPAAAPIRVLLERAGVVFAAVIRVGQEAAGPGKVMLLQ